MMIVMTVMVMEKVEIVMKVHGGKMTVLAIMVMERVEDSDKGREKVLIVMVIGRVEIVMKVQRRC